SVGTCTLVPNGQDPDNECGAVNCGGYHWGWSGDTCYQRADVGAAQASCDGGGTCRSTAVECAASGQGAAQTTCNDLCQDPTSATCTGTTAGTCDNVDQGTDTCGEGACQVTEPVCVDGSPNECMPNDAASSPESCNDSDDNCDGVIDNGAFGDSLEPNGSCLNYRTLNTVTSNQFINYDDLTIFGSGDNDYYRIPAAETDSSCQCCDTFCFDEDYRMYVYLLVPPGSGSYMFCTASACGSVDENCQEVLAGQTGTWEWTFDGACGSDDDYEIFIRVYGDNAPGFECSPYTLFYEFFPGCFDLAGAAPGVPTAFAPTSTVISSN
ncbi:MAG: hypothetical protein AAGC55_27875, partial [Myxococcota bacterium]